MGTVTTTQAEPHGPVPGTAGAPRTEPGIPAALMRPPCDVEILIPAKNEARRLPHALFRMIRYLEQQRYSSALAVIDNGSVDRTVNLVKRLGSGRIGGATLAEPQPGSRILGGAVFRFLAQRILPGIEDSQCGCKFFTAVTARAAIRDLRVTGFAFDVELLQAVLALDVNIVEIPVVWSDQEGSTLNGLRDGIKAVADVFRLARRSTSLCAGSSRS